MGAHCTPVSDTALSVGDYPAQLHGVKSPRMLKGMGRKEDQSWQGGKSHQDPSADDGEATDGESSMGLHPFNRVPCAWHWGEATP